MKPSSKLVIYVAAALAVLALIVGVVMYGLPKGAGEGGLWVVLLFPGMQDDVRRILADDDFLYVVGLGADPHEVQLTPRDVEVLKSANLIVSMGHTHVDKQVENLVRKGDIKARFINIPYIKGLIIPKLPGEDRYNYHELYYDPRNLEIVLSEIVKVLGELRPEKKGYYEEKLVEVKKEIDEIKEYADYMKGCKVIIASAELQPAIQWLGPEIIWYVVYEYAEAPSPDRIGAAIKAMESGDKDKIVVVIGLADHHHHNHQNHGHHHHTFMSKLDERLRDEAKSRGLKVFGVRTGYVGDSVIEGLKDVIEHLKMKNIRC
ncbi:MAG: zinc ABC transporter substrate-binding protein [Thermoprotei archaeon]|nr:zinc ABC transporter substrate-binding protein [Thermoprotei archaeon]